jgi:hypothetical protein
MNQPDRPIAEPRRHKFTKKFYMALPQGVFIVSDATDDEAQPVYSASVPALADRPGRWLYIEAAGVNGRFCSIFESKEAYEAWHRYHLEELLRGYVEGGEG